MPNVEGLAKALRVLENIETEATSITIKVVAVIPSRLEHDVAWARVQSRTRGNIALNVHGNGEKKAYTVFKDIFFEPAAAFLGKAQNVPGALVTDAFWGNLGEVRAATEETLRISGVTLEEMQVGLEEAGGTGGTRGGHAVWACVELPATRLHVTLVPPPGSREEEAEEGRRKEALQKIQKELAGSMVEVGLVRYLSGRAGEKRVGMWTVEEDLGGVTADAHYGRQRVRAVQRERMKKERTQTNPNTTTRRRSTTSATWARSSGQRQKTARAYYDYCGRELERG